MNLNWKHSVCTLLLLLVALPACVSGVTAEAAGADQAVFSKAQLRKIAGAGAFKEYAGNPVLSPGAPGQWDSGAIGSMTLAKAGGLYHMYYEAWGSSAGGSLDYSSLQIGHATSRDGVSWVKDPANPVLSKGKLDSDWDHDGTWDPFILYEDGKFKLWYGGGIDPHCDWGTAESKDGTHFVKKGKISDLGHVEDDHVVHDRAKKRYYMYYWDRSHEPMGLFRVESPDETSFDFKHAEPLKIVGEQYPGMYKFTHVFINDGTWYMLYANFVRPHCADSTTRLAASTDGIHWTRINRNILAGQDGELLRIDSNLFMVFYGPRDHFDAANCDVRLAIFGGHLEELVEQGLSIGGS